MTKKVKPPVGKEKRAKSTARNVAEMQQEKFKELRARFEPLRKKMGLSPSMLTPETLLRWKRLNIKSLEGTIEQGKKLGLLVKFRGHFIRVPALDLARRGYLEEMKAKKGKKTPSLSNYKRIIDNALIMTKYEKLPFITSDKKENRNIKLLVGQYGIVPTGDIYKVLEMEPARLDLLLRVLGFKSLSK